MTLLWSEGLEGWVESAELDDGDLFALLHEAAVNPEHPSHEIGAQAIETVDAANMSEEERAGWITGVAQDPNHPQHAELADALSDPDHPQHAEIAAALGTDGEMSGDQAEALLGSAEQLEDELGRNLTTREAAAIERHAFKDLSRTPDAKLSYLETIGERDMSKPSERRKLAGEVADDAHRGAGGEARDHTTPPRDGSAHNAKALEVANAAFAEAQQREAPQPSREAVE